MAHQMMRQQQLATSNRTSCSRSVVQQPLMPARHVMRQTQRLQQQQLVCMSSKLEDVPLFADSSSVGSKPSGAAVSSSSGQKAGPAKLEDIPLNSELGLDYSDLREYLSAGDVRKADDETRALLIKMAGQGAVQRGWVYFTEVPTIPATDLQTVDALWKAASNGKFGYSVQKEMWVQAGRRWPKFFKAIGWVQGENNVYLKWPAEFIYSFDAVKGHMPLTNALRGTQLFQAIMEHPAFNKGAASSSSSAMSIDERSKAAAKDTLKF